MLRLRKGEGSIVTAEGDLAENLQAQGYVVLKEPGKERRPGRTKSKAAGSSNEPSDGSGSESEATDDG